ncbi:hypothetical protein HF086_011661 [Spodoptera exigua]|uniref:Amino acid transporter transmembrane domain-containing protein n=1 Tax=Spodoptera exigua TaxID=7107 RepID=A0A922SLI6_SPOEX|nr:hypothetical protein HF086_011661 [Spodoptera exigua]
MKKPQNFLGCPSVLVVAMGAIVFLYGTLGMFGYLRYGDVLRGSITLNLPTDEWPAVLAKVSIALSIFLTYPLQFYVVIDIFTSGDRDGASSPGANPQHSWSSILLNPWPRDPKCHRNSLQMG